MMWPWRRPQGLECAFCPWAIADSEVYNKKDRAELVQELKDDDAHATYLSTCLEPYLDKKQELHKSGKRRCIYNFVLCGLKSW